MADYKFYLKGVNGSLTIYEDRVMRTAPLTLFCR